MKNNVMTRSASFFGIVLLAAAIIFGFAACNNDTNSDPELESIEVKTLPVNKQYLGGEFDPTGLVLTLRYSDGSTEDVDSGFTIDPVGFLSPVGPKTVKVRYGNKETTFVINIVKEPPTTFTAATLQPTFDGALTNGNYPQSLAWGNGKFIAVGPNAKMAYSLDFSSWTNVPSGTGSGTSNFPAAEHFQGISWGNNLFVAGGSGGKMVSSPDGTTWNPITQSKISGYINYAVCGADKIVAVGGSKIIYSRDNGVTWADATGLAGTVNYKSVVYVGPNDEKRFIAVGSDGYIAYSSNGEAWTEAKFLPASLSYPGSFCWNKAAYGNGMYIVVGNEGRIFYSQSNMNWEKVEGGTSFGSSENIMDVVWARGTFVAVGGLKITCSSSGISGWNLVPLTPQNITDLGFFSTGSFTCITFGNGKFVIGGRRDDVSNSPGILVYSD